MNILGLIPARGGSKSIPRKNIVPLAGKPLIAHTIEAALLSQRISRTIVSTDDEEIAAVARQWGAEVPFLRLGELARDETPALPVIRHLIQALQDRENWQVDVVVYLQPTSPLRSAEHIDAAIELLLQNHADSVVSMVAVPHQYNPVSVMKIEEGRLVPFLAEGAHVLRRQDKPVVYARNGPAVLVMQRSTILEQNTLYGACTLPFIMDEQSSIDIDTPFDLDLAAWLLDRKTSG